MKEIVKCVILSHKRAKKVDTLNAVVMISQPRYLPCLNFLARIMSCDYYVLMDTVQRNKSFFENRNKIIINGQDHWLTIPSKSASRETICKTIVCEHWIQDHKNSIINAYRKYPFFNIDLLNEIYQDVQKYCPSYLYSILKVLNNTLKLLQIDTKIMLLSDFNVNKSGFELIEETLLQFEDPIYVSGIKGLDYGITNIKQKLIIDDKPFIQYVNGSNCFIPYMSFIDCLFSIGLEETIILLTKNKIQL